MNSNYPYRTIYRIKYDIPVQSKVCVLIHHIENEEEYERTKEKILKKYKLCKIVYKKAS